MNKIPYIAKDDKGITTLFVKGEPFFCLSGEIHNSSASCLDYMNEQVWPKLKGLNMNSVIVPLYWECIEPEEGVYDYSTVEGLINQARENDMKLIFLWFGLWKNGESMYVPGWMKTDTNKYFRVRKVSGEPINTISPLCQAAIDKDAAAFAGIMKKIRELDEEQSTVIFIQVENEIGVLGSPRDYCNEANKAFEEKIPQKLAEALNKDKNLSWKAAFEDEAEESFMAWNFASAVEKITAAGQKEYPLPCYANSWLKQYPWYPGSYPSGGPVTSMHEIWKVAAPSLFALAPDIYVSYVPQIMDEYATEGNPLVIPEVRKDAVTAAYCLYAFGKHNAVCYSPFGIEELNMDPADIDKPPMEVMIALNIDPSAFDIAGSKVYLSKAYGLMEDMKPLYLKYRGTSHLQSYVKKSETDFGTLLKFDKYDLQIAYGPKISGKPLAGGMVYELAEDRFLIIGMQSTFTFMPKAGENVKVEVLKMEEGSLKAGQWIPQRILNGDEKISIRLGEIPACQMIQVFKY